MSNTANIRIDKETLPERINRRMAARLFSNYIGASTLAVYDKRGLGPKSIQVRNAVWYYRDELVDWIEKYVNMDFEFESECSKNNCAEYANRIPATRENVIHFLEPFINTLPEGKFTRADIQTHLSAIISISRVATADKKREPTGSMRTRRAIFYQKDVFTEWLVGYLSAPYQEDYNENIPTTDGGIYGIEK